MAAFNSRIGLLLWLGAFLLPPIAGKKHIRNGPKIGQTPDVASSWDESQVGPYYNFVSRPDLKLIPKTETRAYPPFTRDELSTKPYYLFFGPHKEADVDGPLKTSAMVLKATGEPVWISKDESRYFDLHVVNHNGSDHLVYWTGEMQNSQEYGRTSEGHGVLLDEKYEKSPIGVQGVFRRRCHMHEMNVTPQGTALLLMQDVKEQVHDGKRVKLTDDYIQEVDIATQEVLFDFSVSDNIDVRESYQSLPWDNPSAYHVDAFHANAASKANGKVAISCRHSHQVICADHKSRRWLWTLGGKNSSFTLDPPEAHFKWQHDGRLLAIDGEEYVTMFDNRNVPGGDQDNASRGLMFHLDYDQMVARLVREYKHEVLGSSASQGSMRILDDGDVLVANGGGHGGSAKAALFTEGGQIKFSWDWEGQSYRGLAAEWHGMPNTLPDLVLRRTSQSTEVFVSWNGATQLSKWVLFKTTDPSSPALPEYAAFAEHTWFESHIRLDDGDSAEWIMAVALDSSLQVLSSTYWVNAHGNQMAPAWTASLEHIVFENLDREGFAVECVDTSNRMFTTRNAAIGLVFTLGLSAAGFVIYSLRKRVRDARGYAQVPSEESALAHLADR